MLRTRRLVSWAALAGLAALFSAGHLTPALTAAADSSDGTLTVTVDRDVDADGSYDREVDVPQAGIGIKVSDASGSTVSGVTGGDGEFTMEASDQLTGGRYFVVAEIPAALGDLTPVPESGSFQPLSTTVDVTSESQTVRMGVTQRVEPVTEAAPAPQAPAPARPAPEQRAVAPRFAVGDKVWSDLDRSGQQGSGEPSARTSVQLLNRNGDVVASTISSASGHYLFDKLAAGTYSVRFAGLPGGFKLTAATQGGDRASDSDPDYAGLTPPFTLGVDEPNVRPSTAADRVSADYINPTIDAGITSLRYAVASRVWLDVNHDGLAQPDEPGASATVALITDRRVVATTPTDAEGRFQFLDLAAGDYQLQFTGLPSHRAFAGPRIGSDIALDSDANPQSGLTPEFTLSQRASNLIPGADAGLVGIDFVNPTVSAGLVGVYSIGDTVWRDNNGDSVLDTGDIGVKGVKVQLLGAGDRPLATRTTNSNGRYTFDGLAAGSYRVRFSNLPAGLLFAAQRVGPNTAVDSDANVDGVTDPVAIGDDNPADTTVDAGVTTAADLQVAAAAGSGSPPADSTLSSTGGVAAQIPLTGLGLVLGGVASLLVGQRRPRLDRSAGPVGPVAEH